MKSALCTLGLILLIFGIACTSDTEGVDKTDRENQIYNILWLTAEDMSPRLGVYGDSLAKTPNIDKLAQESIRYTNVFSISGVCAPSRAALAMGMYPTSFGAQHMRTTRRTSAIAQVTDPELLAIPVYEATPPLGAKMVSEILRKEGWYVSNNPKEDYQFLTPLSAWNESSRTAHYENKSEGQPFFSVFNNNITHESQVWKRAEEASFTDPADVVVPPYYPDHPDVRKDMARHYDNIAELDKWVGEKLKELEESGEADRTIVFFFSDHGDGLPRSKRWVYDSGLHVPLLVRFPDRQLAGTVSDELISFIDFAPTLLSLNSIPIPSHMEGQAFLGKEKGEPREYIFAARDRMDPAMERRRAVRDKRFKYIKNYMSERPYIQFLPYRDQMDLMKVLNQKIDDGSLAPDQWQISSTSKPLEELYDTDLDPYEINNLAEKVEYQDLMAEFRSAHKTWTKEYGDLGQQKETELIKQLWAPDGIQPTTEAPFVTENREGIIKVESKTTGASIVWKVGDGERWNLYTNGVETTEWERANSISDSEIFVEFMAHRIGFKESSRTKVKIVG